MACAYGKWAYSSAGERLVDIEEVTSSILVTPTIFPLRIFYIGRKLLSGWAYFNRLVGPGGWVGLALLAHAKGRQHSAIDPLPDQILCRC